MQVSVVELRRSINIHKLLRNNIAPLDLTVELETTRAMQLIHEYMNALPLGRDLPETELQPADDLAIIAGQIFVNMYSISEDHVYLHSAAIILEFALKKSPQSYQTRLQLVKVYRLLCRHRQLVQSTHLIRF